MNAMPTSGHKLPTMHLSHRGTSAFSGATKHNFQQAQVALLVQPTNLKAKDIHLII